MAMSILNLFTTGFKKKWFVDHLKSESTLESSKENSINYPPVNNNENSSKTSVENGLNFDYLEKLKLLGELRRDNVLTEEEFEKEKKKILDSA